MKTLFAPSPVGNVFEDYVLSKMTAQYELYTLKG